MKVKNKLFIATMLTLASACMLTGLSYAYFAYQENLDIGDVDVAEATYTSVSSEYELHKYIVDYNDNSNATISSNRGEVVLSGDIILTTDMIITKDIALNLSTYNFDLNGHNLTILHNYEGQTLIEKESDTTGFINTSEVVSTIDLLTPNATIRGNALTDLTNITVYNYDEDRLVSKIYSFVSSRMFKYYHKDLALPMQYYGYDIEFNYTFTNDPTSSEASKILVDDYGRIVELPSVSTLVSMELSLTSPSFVNTHESLKVDFTLLSKYEALTYFDERFASAEEEILDYLEFYRYGSVDEGYYAFDNIALPSKASYYDITYTYQTYELVEGTRVETFGNIENYILYLVNRNTMVGQRNIVVAINMTLDDNGTIHTYTREVAFHMTSLSNYDLASTIIDNMGIIMLQNGSFTLPTLDELAGYNVKNVTYAIDGDYYQLTGDENNVITPKENGYPSILTKVYLDITFEFYYNTPIIITSKNRIYYDGYISGEGGGETYDDYLLSYNEINADFAERYLDDNGHVLNSFTLANVSSLRSAIHYGLILTNNIPNDPTIISFEGMNSISVNGKELISVNNAAGQAEFTINYDAIPLEDTYVSILYSFNNITWYARYTSFVIPGVIRSDAVTDPVLYEAIKNAYDSNGDGILLTQEARATRYEPFVLDGLNITDWTGIELLTYTHNLEIDNINVDQEGISHIGHLTRLNSLTLSNANLSDSALSSLPRFDNLTYLNISNNNLTSLANLKAMGSLIELDASHNALTNIDSLAGFPSLESVDVSYNQLNTFNALRSIENLKKAIVNDNLATGSSATLYGSTGAYNVTTFTILSNNNVEIYNRIENGTLVLFAPTEDDIKGSEILEAIVYTSNAGANNSIQLTQIIYDRNGNVLYTITYTSDDFTIPNTPDAEKISVDTSVASSGSYHIIASVTINGTTYYRILEVTM